MVGILLSYWGGLFSGCTQDCIWDSDASGSGNGNRILHKDFLSATAFEMPLVLLPSLAQIYIRADASPGRAGDTKVLFRL